MKFECTIKGITLDMSEMSQVNFYYEAACTAEYLLDNYEVSEEKALDYGYEVRRLMNKYGYSEEEAIEELSKTVPELA